MTMKPRIILLGLLVVFAGCNETSGPIVPKNRPAETSSWPAKPEPGVYISPGKPRSPIGIEHEITSLPVPGVPIRIDLTIRSNAAISGLTGEVRAGEGLFLAPESARFSLADVVPGEPARHALTVTPLAEGMHRLTVVVQGWIAGQFQANTLSIPLRVGAVATQPVEEAGEEGVIRLPAR
jgi:hypothetical protein